MKICIIGGGTYGSYLAKIISEASPTASITILEAGSEHTRSEESMGFYSESHGAPYSALTRGRYFGLGGSSARWGGQILTFERDDFSQPSQFLSDIVELNELHREKVLKRLGVSNTSSDQRINGALKVKTGVWLSYGKRNLYESLGVASLANVDVRTNCRVTRMLHENGRITGIRFLDGNVEKTETFDQYFLTTGAFESNRLLAVSGLSEDRFPFSDHLSQRAFKIRGAAKVGATDLRFRFRGTSLVTRRFVGEVGGVSFFAHPIFNSEFRFFQILKEILYQRRITLGRIVGLFLRLPQAIAFFFHMFVLRRLYVHKGEWYLQLDLENFHDSGQAFLSEQLDAQGQRGLEVELTIDERTNALFSAARTILRQHLENEKVDFDEIVPATHSDKYEDTYHPYGMFGSDNTSATAFFNLFSNLLVANTGILPRAGSINCTAAVLPLLEEYVTAHLARVCDPPSRDVEISR